MNSQLLALVEALKEKINQLHVVSKGGKQKTEAFEILKQIEELLQEQNND